MTTFARPTWAPAKGGREQGGTRIFGPSQKYSSRDIASHTTLKPRCVSEILMFEISILKILIFVVIKQVCIPLLQVEILSHICCLSTLLASGELLHLCCI
ncbi:hypothetical protein AMTRI_Chr13g92900 [Amborella trichopoda]|uniref:Uncharacterized protein n=1 Tax=Amborella trichopoda TaxID=13333 RepID=U5D7R6_AMBTC|nr:hypothetical protein AMTR_s00059p00023330 [Amborella trichopoda]